MSKKQYTHKVLSLQGMLNAPKMTIITKQNLASFQKILESQTTPPITIPQTRTFFYNKKFDFNATVNNLHPLAYYFQNTSHLNPARCHVLILEMLRAATFRKVSICSCYSQTNSTVDMFQRIVDELYYIPMSGELLEFLARRIFNSYHYTCSMCKVDVQLNMMWYDYNIRAIPFLKINPENDAGYYAKINLLTYIINGLTMAKDDKLDQLINCDIIKHKQSRSINCGVTTYGNILAEFILRGCYDFNFILPLALIFMTCGKNPNTTNISADTFIMNSDIWAWFIAELYQIYGEEECIKELNIVDYVVGKNKSVLLEHIRNGTVYAKGYEKTFSDPQKLPKIEANIKFMCCESSNYNHIYRLDCNCRICNYYNESFTSNQDVEATNTTTDNNDNQPKEIKVVITNNETPTTEELSSEFDIKHPDIDKRMNRLYKKYRHILFNYVITTVKTNKITEIKKIPIRCFETEYLYSSHVSQADPIEIKKTQNRILADSPLNLSYYTRYYPTHHDYSDKKEYEIMNSFNIFTGQFKDFRYIQSYNFVSSEFDLSTIILITTDVNNDTQKNIQTIINQDESFMSHIFDTIETSPKYNGILYIVCINCKNANEYIYEIKEVSDHLINKLTSDILKNSKEKPGEVIDKLKDDIINTVNPVMMKIKDLRIKIKDSMEKIKDETHINLFNKILEIYLNIDSSRYNINLLWKVLKTISNCISVVIPAFDQYSENLNNVIYWDDLETFKDEFKKSTIHIRDDIMYYKKLKNTDNIDENFFIVLEMLIAFYEEVSDTIQKQEFLIEKFSKNHELIKNENSKLKAKPQQKTKNHAHIETSKPDNNGSQKLKSTHKKKKRPMNKIEILIKKNILEEKNKKVIENDNPSIQLSSQSTDKTLLQDKLSYIISASSAWEIKPDELMNNFSLTTSINEALEEEVTCDETEYLLETQVKSRNVYENEELITPSMLENENLYTEIFGDHLITGIENILDADDKIINPNDEKI